MAFAKALAASDGATIVAATAGYSIRVVAAVVSSVGAGSVSFKSNTTDISGLFNTNTTTIAIACERGLFETVAGEALKLGIVGTTYISITYILVNPTSNQVVT